MKKSYVCIFNNDLGTSEEVRNFLDNCDNITAWRRELPNTFFIVSELSAYRIFDLVHAHFGEKNSACLIMEYAQSNSQGLLNKRSWSLLNEKKLPPKES